MCSSNGGDGKTCKHVAYSSILGQQHGGDGSDVCVCVCGNGVYENGRVYELKLK